MPVAALPAAAGAERQLESRLKWLMLGRLTAALVGLFGGLLVQPLEPETAPPYVTLLAAFLLNLVYLIAARAGVRTRSLAVVQILLDVALLGLLIYLTGLDLFFAILFFAVVFAAAMLLGLRWAVLVASLASILLAVVSTVFFVSALPGYEFRLPLVSAEVVRAYEIRRTFIVPYLFFFALSLHVVAVLAGRLTAEIRRIRILNEEILQSMAGGVLAADRYGGIQFINAPAARILGLKDPDAVRGQPYEVVLPKPLAEILRRALRGRERVEAECQVNFSPVRVGVSCLFDADGETLRGVVAILNDLSLRTQMEEMTRRAERFKALLEMSAGMAHEIRNPLASIRGAAQELESSQLPKEEDRQLLRVVMRESDRLDQIIGEFLDYASDRPIDLGLCDVAEVLRETVLLLEARRQRDVAIAREIPKTLVCRGSPDKLKQVFLNLGLNALEACTGIGRPGRLLIRCAPDRGSDGAAPESVLVEFSDNGCGVSRENEARVFDPFFTTKPNGVGMGLALARKIVQAHNGEITFRSEEGKGTCVRVVLPT
jgi:two-component system sensor histidine kinase PilS (NtrC family)